MKPFSFSSACLLATLLSPALAVEKGGSLRAAEANTLERSLATVARLLPKGGNGGGGGGGDTGTGSPTVAPTPNDPAPACPVGDLNCVCLGTADPCTDDVGCLSLTCSSGPYGGQTCASDSDCPKGNGFADCSGSVAAGSCACAAEDEAATSCGAADDGQAAAKCCGGLVCDPCSNACVSGAGPSASCDAWCKSGDIFGYYLTDGLECGDSGGFFSYVTSTGETCSNNCYSSANEDATDCTVGGSGICCCDCGVTPIPVQMCGSYSTSGNTDYCRRATGVHDSCGDCMDLHERYALTDITGSMGSDGTCYCSLEYTDNGAAVPPKIVWDSTCAYNVDAGTTFESFACSA